jgi:hypothetical protein
LGRFYLSGPPNSYSGVVELPVVLSDPTGDADMQPYMSSFGTSWTDEAGVTNLPTPPGNLKGVVWQQDYLPNVGCATLLSHEGPTWGIGQHLYIRQSTKAEWREVSVGHAGPIRNPALLLAERGPVVVLSFWHSWWPYSQNVGRYISSFTRQELRPENGFYLLDLQTFSMKYLFPGQLLSPSPDRKRMLFARPDIDGDGFWSIHIWTPQTGAIQNILSAWEGDPGSGIDWRFRWSPDSSNVLFRGSSQGFASSSMDGFRKLNLIYNVKSGRLYDAYKEPKATE